MVCSVKWQMLSTQLSVSTPPFAHATKSALLEQGVDIANKINISLHCLICFMLSGIIF